jgi:hypothetical protein
MRSHGQDGVVQVFAVLQTRQGIIPRQIRQKSAKTEAIRQDALEGFQVLET